MSAVKTAPTVRAAAPSGPVWALTTTAWALALVALQVGALSVADHLANGPVLLGVLGLAAVLGGATDGWRGTALRPLVRRWAVVAVVAGLAGPLLNQWGGTAGMAWLPLVADLLTVTLFLAGLVFAAAVVTGVLVVVLRDQIQARLPHR